MAKNIFILALVILLIILLLKYCGKGKDVPDSVTIDTTYVHHYHDTGYIPEPKTIYVPGTAPKALTKWDTLYVEGVTVVDTLAILKDYHSSVLYSDTLKNPYGHVIINDTINRNRIAGRGAIYSLMIPTITKTITKHEQPRRQVYAGGGVFGNAKDFLGGYQVQLNLKTKSNQMVGVGWLQRFQGGNYVSINYSRLIKLKK